MKKNNLTAQILVVILYGCLTLAGLFFLIHFIIKLYKKRRIINLDNSLSDGDLESFGTDEVLTAPSYIKGAWKFTFYAFLTVGCAIRIIFFTVFGIENFVVHSSCSESEDELRFDIQETLLAFPTYVFFVAYYILLCCLAEIYFITHKNEGQERITLYRKLHYQDDPFGGGEYRNRDYRCKNVQLIVVTVFIMAVFVANTLALFLRRGDSKNTLVATQYTTVVLYFIISTGYCVFGWLIFLQSRRMVMSLPTGDDIDSDESFKIKKDRSKCILLGNSIATLLFFFIFIVRSIFLVIQTYLYYADRSNKLLSNWVAYFLYYAIFEAVPLVLGLYLFTVLPGKERRKKTFSFKATY